MHTLIRLTQHSLTTMPVYHSNLLISLLLATVILLASGCAQPAHKNTPPWSLTNAYTEVTIVAPDKYLVDGMFFNGASFEQWLEHRARLGLTLPLLLKSTDELNLFKRRNYFEMATIAETAEGLGYQIYYSTAGIIHLETTTAELMAIADNQSESDSENPDDAIIINSN